MKICLSSAMLLLVLACVPFSPVRAEETPLTDEGMRLLIKDLGSDDFEKRQGAEKKLAAQGLKAEALLKATVEATTDAQVRATAARLLGKLKLAGLSSVDYLTVFPAESVMFIQIRDVSKSIEKSKETAIGKLVLSPALEPFRKKLEEAINQKANEKKTFDTWFKRFNGQFGFAMWNFSAMPDQMRLAALFQISDPNPQAVFDEFMAETGMAQLAQKGESYRDVDIYQSPQGAGGMIALAGPHIILSVNRESLKTAIDNLLKPGGLAASPSFAKIRPSLGEKPELMLGMDYRTYMKQLLAMMEVMGQADEAKAMEKVWSSMGTELQHLIMASASNGDRYEDRIVMTMGSEPKGMMAASLVPADAPAPLEDMAIVPANAVAAAVGYLNGKELQVGAKDYIAALGEMVAAQRNKLPPDAQKAQPDFTAEIKAFEDKIGMKMEEAFAGFKGSLGYYVVLSKDGLLAAPDLGMFMTFADKDAATKFSNVLRKALDNSGPVPIAAVREVEAPNRKLLQIDLNALGAALPPNFPYMPVWVVENNRIFFASSVEALRKQLSYIDTKTPGLLTQADFVKAMGLLKPDERRGQVFYVNMKSLMTLGSTVALPFLQAAVPDEGLKKALAALPPPEELFKDMPPLLGTSVGKGAMFESVMRGPIPPIPGAMLIGVGAAFFGIQQQRKMMGVQPENPGGF